ncbi:Uncharacterised protein [Streptococcus agalactiae]|uniref:Uncharacterized protein n=1 Tax=Streptococcus agalactiae TaxID=1311 RepID=A0A8B4RB93_STRAG|nr:Uncharacterised protein [Streptococcus agalactiae]
MNIEEAKQKLHNGSVGLRAGILVKLTLEAFCKYSAA